MPPVAPPGAPSVPKLAAFAKSFGPGVARSLIGDSDDDGIDEVMGHRPDDPEPSPYPLELGEYARWPRCEHCGNFYSEHDGDLTYRHHLLEGECARFNCFSMPLDDDHEDDGDVPMSLGDIDEGPSPLPEIYVRLL
jgi:hypothetical protein